MTDGIKGVSHDDNIVVELAVLHSRIEGHEISCGRYQRMFMWVAGGAASIILMIAIQLAVVSGRQEVLLTRLEAQSTRMIETEREVVEMRRDMEAHLRQTATK